jgi:hypothetical protein
MIVGRGRIATLSHCSSTLYQTHEENQYLFSSSDDATESYLYDDTCANVGQEAKRAAREEAELQRALDVSQRAAPRQRGHSRPVHFLSDPLSKIYRGA